VRDSLNAPKGHWGYAAAFVAAMGPTSLLAQGAAEEGLRRQEERAREAQRSNETRPDALVAPQAWDQNAALPLEQVCFVVRDLQLTGEQAQRFGWLLDSAVPFLRRCVGARGLAFIASKLDQKLHELGYATTRVSLPPQNLADGQLRIHIHVGRVEAIRMERSGTKGDPDESWGTWRNAFPLSTGDVLNIRDLEQGVENMRRLPTQGVSTRLEPGTQAGETLVIIERETAAPLGRIRGGITLDNGGNVSLGRTQASGNLAVDNVAGMNDVLGLSLSGNAEHPHEARRSQSASINYSLPWGYNLLSIGRTSSRFAQYVQGTTVRFVSSGQSESTYARLERTMWRSASARLGLHAEVSARRATSYLDDVELVVQRRRTTTLETGLNFRRLLGDSVIEFDLGYRRGMPWRAAQEDFPDAAAGGLTLRPRIVTFGASYTTAFRPFGRTGQFSATLRGQSTRDQTLSVDQFAIGGRSSVRGFDGDAVLLAESGTVLRNEWLVPVSLVQGMESSVLMALDLGHVSGPSEVFLAGNKLAGAALGLRGRTGKARFELALATPLYRPQGFASRRLNLYATFTHAF
jgi:hemolysin activation/secretion protein